MFRNRNNDAGYVGPPSHAARVGELWKRIYHYHIRRSGGSSLNFAFLSLGGENGVEVYRELTAAEPHRVVSGGRFFIGWERRLIEEGDYFYAFSHLPKHRLELPRETFTFTCLRDPVDRVVSHYKLLRRYVDDSIPHPCLKTEGPWLGDGFCHFLSNIPKEHLLNQLYMFSKTFDVSEAFDNITGCSNFSFTENRRAGLAALSAKLGLRIDLLHANDTSKIPVATTSELERLREMLEPEYRLLERFEHLPSSLHQPQLAR